MDLVRQLQFESGEIADELDAIATRLEAMKGRIRLTEVECTLFETDVRTLQMDLYAALETAVDDELAEAARRLRRVSQLRNAEEGAHS